MSGEWTFIWAAYLVTWTALLGYRLYLRARAAEIAVSDIPHETSDAAATDENMKETQP